MTEYLIRAGSDQWQIGTPDATTGIIEEQCASCLGSGIVVWHGTAGATSTTSKRRCERCKGQGRVGRNDPDTIKLCWVARDGAIICYAGDEDQVARLPE